MSAMTFYSSLIASLWVANRIQNQINWCDPFNPSMTKPKECDFILKVLAV